MTACIVLGLLATPASGAASSSSLPAPVNAAPVSCPPGAKRSGSGCIDRHPAFVERCPGVRAGLRFYRSAYNQHREDRGAQTSWPVGRKPLSCTDARQLARVWRMKAKVARVKLERWLADKARVQRDEWNWQAWLPDKWYRIARCETGVRWDWNSGAYQGAFGFATSSWDSFRLAGYPSEAYLASPRQQYEVALAIWRRYGFSGWGCRNA